MMKLSAQELVLMMLVLASVQHVDLSDAQGGIVEQMLMCQKGNESRASALSRYTYICFASIM